MRDVTLAEAVYKALQTVMDRGGEFLREVSVLLVLFVPLEIWRTAADYTLRRVLGLLTGVAILFLFGMACEWTALATKRARMRYEEVNFGPRTGD